jgi:hypothetical protein
LAAFFGGIARLRADHLPCNPAAESHPESTYTAREHFESFICKVR